MATIFSKSDLRRVCPPKHKRDCTQKQWVDREWAKHQARQKNKDFGTKTYRHTNCPIELTFRTALISLSDRQTTNSVKNRVMERAKNFDGFQAADSTYRSTNDCGRYSSRCTWTHYTYTVCVMSWCYLHPKCIAYRCDVDGSRKSGKCFAPHGYRFDSDKDGYLIIVRNSCGTEFHPTIDDLVKGKAHLRDCILESVKRRKEARKLDRVLTTVCVTWHDARMAGNCPSGIKRYCDDSHIDQPNRLNRAVLASRLPRSRPGVEATIQCAYRRETEVQI